MLHRVPFLNSIWILNHLRFPAAALFLIVTAVWELADFCQNVADCTDEQSGAAEKKVGHAHWTNND